MEGRGAQTMFSELSRWIKAKVEIPYAVAMGDKLYLHLQFLKYSLSCACVCLDM